MIGGDPDLFEEDGYAPPEPSDLEDLLVAFARSDTITARALIDRVFLDDGSRNACERALLRLRRAA